MNECSLLKQFLTVCALASILASEFLLVRITLKQSSDSIGFYAFSRNQKAIKVDHLVWCRKTFKNKFQISLKLIAHIFSFLRSLLPPKSHTSTMTFFQSSWKLVLLMHVLLAMSFSNARQLSTGGLTGKIGSLNY